MHLGLKIVGWMDAWPDDQMIEDGAIYEEGCLFLAKLWSDLSIRNSIFCLV